MENDTLSRLRTMMLIRVFETELASRREHGFQLLSTGEEAVAAGVCQALLTGDDLLTGGRSIGFALARGVEPHHVAAELLGKVTGTNRGKGGRGHISQPEVGFFGAHAVVGGNISIAAGVALAKKMDGNRGIVAVVFGDGACGAGALHETLNIAANWKLPLLFVCNNNRFSVSTPRDLALAPRQLSQLGQPFGLAARTVDGMCVATVAEAAASAVEHVRAGQGPFLLECISQRFSSHSTTARETRSPDELARIRIECPIVRESKRLHDSGLLSDKDQIRIETEARHRVAEAFQFAADSPYPAATEVLTDVD